MFVSVANKFFLFYFETAITHHSVLSFICHNTKAPAASGVIFLLREEKRERRKGEITLALLFSFDLLVKNQIT